MLVAFFESIKYVGHLYPIALLRVYMGYYFFDLALSRVKGEFLTQPRLAAIIMDSLPQSDLPAWYARFLQYVVVPQWQYFAYLITYCEFLLGISFLLGIIVRPASLLAVFMMVNFIVAGGNATSAVQQVFLVLFIVMAWVGAGRCLGLDYFFYKRHRGIWW
jgi:thiosulfate dehydrogenase (quinone) large subunit